MLKLYQFPRVWGLPNPSPFCMKIETYLRMVGLPYESIKQSNPSSAPKGKLPYIDDRGAIVADSSLIIRYLKKEHGDKLDRELSADERATGIAFQRTIEEHPSTMRIFLDSRPAARTTEGL